MLRSLKVFSIYNVGAQNYYSQIRKGEQTNQNIFSDFFSDFFSFDANDFNICKFILSFHSFKSVFSFKLTSSLLLSRPFILQFRNHTRFLKLFFGEGDFSFQKNHIVLFQNFHFQWLWRQNQNSVSFVSHNFRNIWFTNINIVWIYDTSRHVQFREVDILETEFQFTLNLFRRILLQKIFLLTILVHQAVIMLQNEVLRHLLDIVFSSNRCMLGLCLHCFLIKVYFFSLTNQDTLNNQLWFMDIFLIFQ